jgi:hypothetical protein
MRQLPDGQYRNSILRRKVNCRTVETAHSAVAT